MELEISDELSKVERPVQFRTIRQLALEITGKCQLRCVHCYADSSPVGVHGEMAREDWIRVIKEASKYGVHRIQFIGGEPTLHPELPYLIDYALDCGLPVEVFTNLVHVTGDLWKTFSRRGVSLATSYYSDAADQHASITNRMTYTQTRANIVEALSRSIPVRVGIIGVQDGQRTEQARRELEALGVCEIKVDRMRLLGRGGSAKEADIAELCGHCTQGMMAISSSGDVWPCVFARWMPVGNVRRSTFLEIVTGPRVAEVMNRLTKAFEGLWGSGCNPPSCHPTTHPAPQPNPKTVQPAPNPLEEMRDYAVPGMLLDKSDERKSSTPDCNA